MKFEWDPEKAADNVKKHGVSFEAGSEVFDDPLEITKFDDSHSGTEIRFSTIGTTQRGVLFVGYTIPIPETIRIITVRHATGREKQEYYEE